MATRTTGTGRDGSRQQGSFTAGDGGGGRKRGGWLWWLLGAVALAAAVILLLSLLGGDDDEGQRAGEAASVPADASPAPTGAGSLIAGGSSLLPVPSAGLASYAGESATGEDVRVQSVVEDEGFWIGSSERERVYVEYGGGVGQDEAQRFVPEVGERVNLAGPVRPAPADPEQTLNLPAADARLVTEQGAYVNAERVSRP